MFRLLGILAIGNLLFGGRRHRRALRRGLFLGALLGFFSSRNADMNRAREEAREAARKAGNAARDAARAAREAVRNARRAEDGRQAAEVRYAARPERETEAADVIRALPQSGTREAKEIEELVGDLERNAATAAMAANVPTIDFPEEEDDKYYASRKYSYVQ